MTNNVLQDLHGRVHNYLRISITEQCNLRCTYCMPADGIALTPRPNLMTVEEIFSIAKTFVSLGVTKIRLTGGEPLVHKEAAKIIAGLAKLGVQLSLTTNGILVDRFIEVFKEAKITSINVSIDSLIEEKFNSITRRSYFKKVLQNIDLLIENNLEVRLNVVLIKNCNDNEILDFIALTEAKKLQIRFIEFMPFDGNEWKKDKLVTEKEILAKVTVAFGPEKINRLVDKPNDTARNFGIEGFLGSFSIISSVSNPFCSTCNRIRLTSDGKLKNCLFSNSETPLLEALRAGDSILPLIAASVASKKHTRAGMDTNEKFQNPALFLQNRSMIKIGG